MFSKRTDYTFTMEHFAQCLSDTYQWLAATSTSKCSPFLHSLVLNSGLILKAPQNPVITARSELRKVLFFAPSVCFLFVYEISWEPWNGFAPNSHGRRVWPLARNSLKVKVKGHRSRPPGTKNDIFRPFSATCVRFIFGKTSLASSFHMLLTTPTCSPSPLSYLHLNGAL